tara:strand:+ start:12552 stop:13595 length:1044 start_codon:yes stop_codon:yes gene_type:complete
MDIKNRMKNVILSSYFKAAVSIFFISLLVALFFGVIDDAFDEFWYTFFASWVMFYLPASLFLFIYRLLSSGIPIESYINNPHDEALDSLLKQLRVRSKASRGISILALLLIGACIFMGVYIFLSAPSYSRTADLYRFEVRTDAISIYKRKREDLEQILTKINVFGLDKYLKLYPEEAYSALNLKPEKPTQTGRSNKEYQKSLSSFISATMDVDRQKSIKEEISKLRDLSNTKVKEEVEKSKPDESSAENENYYFLISTTITRVTTILLILFLLRILLELYRYSAKLAAFYDSRADSMQLSPKDTPDELILSLAFFSAETLEFKSGNIEGPYDRIIELAKQAMERLRK